MNLMAQSVAIGRRASERSLTWATWGVFVGVFVFAIGWLLGGAIEGHGYSAARDEISDLTAVTAHHAWLLMGAGVIAGVLIIAFAAGPLRRSLTVPGRGDALGAWLLAASLMGLDNVSDAFFRLDCRAADAGCTRSVAMTSVHGKLHIIVGMTTALITVATPFVLARRMRLVPGWRDLARLTIAFGVLFFAVLFSYVALEDSSVQGFAQRGAIVLASVGVVALALRVRKLARATSTGRA